MPCYEGPGQGLCNDKTQQIEAKKNEEPAGEIQAGDKEIEIEVKNTYNDSIEYNVPLGGWVNEIGPEAE